MEGEMEVRTRLHCQLSAFLMETSDIIMPGAAQHTFQRSRQAVAQTNQLDLPPDDSIAQYLNLEQVEETWASEVSQTFDKPEVQPYVKFPDELSSQVSRFQGLRNATVRTPSLFAQRQDLHFSESHPGLAQLQDEMHEDFILNNTQGRDGSFGLQLESSMASNVVPSSQHFSAHVPEEDSGSLDLVDFSHANYRPQNAQPRIFCSTVSVRDSISTNTSKVIGIANGTVPVFDKREAQAHVGVNSRESVELASDAVFPASSIDPREQEQHSSQSHAGQSQSQYEMGAVSMLSTQHGMGGPLGFELHSTRSNMVPSSKHFSAHVSQDSRSHQPAFDVFHANLGEKGSSSMILFPFIPMPDSNCTSTSFDATGASGAVPVFLSDDCSGSLPPLSVTPVLSPWSPVSPHGSSTATFLSHSLPYPEDTMKRPRLETEGLTLPGIHVRRTARESDAVTDHATKSYREQPNTDPDLVPAKHKGRIDPLEKELTEIITKMMGSFIRFHKADHGLADKLARILHNHKRCRNESTPIHIGIECAFITDSTTAVKCCWSKTFGSINFPDEKRIMESFRQVCTRAVNDNLEEKRRNKGGRGVYGFPDFVNESCEEFFQLYEPFRHYCPIKHTAQVELATKLGIRLEQVQNKMRNLQRKKDKKEKSRASVLQLLEDEKS